MSAPLLGAIALATCARSGRYVELYPNGQTHRERHFVNGQKDGRETVWRRSGKKEEEGEAAA